MITEFKGRYSFLSNFYMGAPIPSAEHLFQAAKTRTRDDFEYVMAATTPGEAKRRGRLIPIRPDWDDIRDFEMYAILLLKFANPSLRKLLLATGEEHLEEGNTWGDTYWGTCKGKGENRLGELLMVVRDFYR